MTGSLPEMKRCSCCGVFKGRTVEFFHRRARSHDGLREQCKVCVAVYQNNLDRGEYWRAYHAAHAANDPSYLEKKRARATAYNHAHRTAKGAAG
jgi:hypothetical protein